LEILLRVQRAITFNFWTIIFEVLTKKLIYFSFEIYLVSSEISVIKHNCIDVT